MNQFSTHENYFIPEENILKTMVAGMNIKKKQHMPITQTY